MKLHDLKPKKGSQKTRKRVGRGLGSTGTYSGRGNKGQRSRSGGKRGLKLMGLRKIMLSIPKKRGFTSLHPHASVVNVGDLSRVFSAGEQVTPGKLQEKGLIATTAHGVKVLGKGSLSIALQISGCRASASAQKKIMDAGGSLASL